MKISQNVEIELIIEGDYIPMVKGRYNCKPEDSYPDEPADFEIKEVLIKVVDNSGQGTKIKYIPCPQDIINMIDFNELVNDADEYYQDLKNG